MNTDHLHFSPTISAAVQAQVIERLTDWEFGFGIGEIQVSPLYGGLNNTNLSLQNQLDQWVLKIRPENFALFGAAAVASLMAQPAAAKVGAAPKVVAFDKSQCHFLSEFLSGETLRPDYVRQNNLLANVVETLH